jgi:hypothetical protein
MKFTTPTWRAVAIVLSAINLVATGFAAQAGEALHAGTHAALTLAFGLWALQIHHRLASGAGQDRLGEGQARFEEIDAELANLRRELGEVQERLDFTERVLANQSEKRQLGERGNV